MFEFEGAIVCKVAALDLLHPSKRQKLEKELFESACAGFNREQDEAFREDVGHHLREGSLYVAIVDGRAEGFAVMTDFPEISGTYIAGIVKNPLAPSGVIEQIVDYHLGSKNIRVVTTRTQNDRVVEIMRNACCEVVPVDREANENDREILEAMKLHEGVRADLVKPEHYGGKSLISGKKRRRSQDEAVVKTSERLNYEKGDAMLVIGYRKGGL